MGWINKDSGTKKYKPGGPIAKSAKEVGKNIDPNTPKPGGVKLKADPLETLRNKHGNNKVNFFISRSNSKNPKIKAGASEIFNDPQIDAEIIKAMSKKEEKQ
jgi:hypothetical protein